MTKDFKLESEEIIMPLEMLKLRGSLPTMDKKQLEFLICHLMRRYVKNPSMFDLVYESKKGAGFLGVEGMNLVSPLDQFFYKEVILRLAKDYGYSVEHLSVPEKSLVFRFRPDLL